MKRTTRTLRFLITFICGMIAAGSIAYGLYHLIWLVAFALAFSNIALNHLEHITSIKGE